MCENKDFSYIVMPSEDTKILEFNQYQKSDKASFIFYVDLECLIEKIDWYKNNPENSSTTKMGEHIPQGFSRYKILSFMVYIEVNIAWKSFVNFLRQHTTEIMNFNNERWSMSKRTVEII